jgi:hypothetical protein
VAQPWLGLALYKAGTVPKHNVMIIRMLGKQMA